MGKVIDSRSRFANGHESQANAKLYQALADLYSQYVKRVEAIRKQAADKQRSQDWVEQELSSASSQYHYKRQQLLQSTVE